MAGHTDDALATLAGSHTPEPWEQAVAAALRALCHAADGQADGTVTAATAAYDALADDPADLVFRARLGLTLLDVAQREADQDRVATSLIATVMHGNDGRSAADVLAHRGLQATSTARGGPLRASALRPPESA
jgi:hypothetical protein